MTVERHAIPANMRLHPLRQQDITASDLGAILGVDPYRTPFDVWAQKAKLASPPEENAAMTRGRWLEAGVVAAMREIHPHYIIRYPLELYLRDPDLRLGGTPDADGRDVRTSETIAFEFKVISRDSYTQRWADGPPLGYQLQTLCNAMLLDADRGVLAALALGWQDAELVVHDIPRHAGAEERIRQTAVRFWDAFEDGHALAVPDYERDAAAIRQVFRPDAGKPAPLDLSGDNRIAFLCEEWGRLGQEESAAKKGRETVKAEILVKLNGSTAAVADGWKITNEMQHRAAHTVKESDYPVMRVTKNKEAAI